MNELVIQGFLYGILYAGVSAIFGFGVAGAINIFKHFGGVR